ncbi:ABC transporter ATP-binding protein [Enterovirga rhinocerotis]|uniref:Iron complex transport system ATP-binding protein n=1 Tax=Enterovirga rhinocerotis TaxID=1339210 RepID=A0A4R7C7F4_9HYPH|nr:ABC transporter ATP-binding protein [Enterovirga rhinocerotis]TDR94564.1 iron complex transport system ATP-binding protein [Enterovirga rhinocerotis]
MSLAVEDLGVALGGRSVVEGVSFASPAGRFLALVGPNGAGKTSLLRGLAGLVRASGRIRLGEDDLAALAPRERARRVAYLPQGHEAHWPLPARDIVALGRIPHGAGDPTRLSPRDAEAVEEAMRLTDTLAFADRAVTTLSGGERARVALARVFAVGAPLVLADEPTAALDPGHQIAVMQALRGAARAGAIVVAVTHDLGLAARFADRVLVLDGGRIAADGEPEDALSAETLRRVFGVEAYRDRFRDEAVLVPWA